MYCPNCGSEVMEDAKFCPSCGLEIKLPRDGDKDEASSNAKNSNASKASASGDANDGAANFINIWSSLSTAKKNCFNSCSMLHWIDNHRRLAWSDKS